MIVVTAAGRVRGVPSGPVTAFRGIPYAHADRFAAPRPVPPWSGVWDADSAGPAAPQTASRLEHVMGPFQTTQAEQCLSLNVFAPPGDGHPVLVFLHGGGFTSGSGGLDWYDGTELAAFGDLVVVTINYRLGVLGFLRLPPVSEGNLGLLDQIAALRWVTGHIDAFGGDPANITVAGQSAGAQSILALLSGGRASGLFQRAILQSTPAGMLPAAPQEAERTGRLLLQQLDLTPGTERRLADIPVEVLLAAQGAVARSMAAPLRVAPPFQLAADGDLVAADPVTATGTRAADGVRILMGTTRDEAAAFFTDTPRTTVDMVTDQVFGQPARRLARSLTENAAAPWLYRFDWHPPCSPYGACHCIELPFVLGTAAAWRNAPMLAGDPPPGLVHQVRRSWTGFVRGGDPGWARGTTHHFTG